jgi:hypothetical protein
MALVFSSSEQMIAVQIVSATLQLHEQMPAAVYEQQQIPLFLQGLAQVDDPPSTAPKSAEGSHALWAVRNNDERQRQR